MSSKSKGSSYERLLSKELTKWLTGNEKPYNFWRTHASGAIQTLDACNTGFAGDIMPITPEAHKIMNKIVIEAKCGYKNISFDKFFKDNKNDPLKEFWDQCIGETKDQPKHPVLIYKKSGFPVIVLVYTSMAKKLNKNLLNNDNMVINWAGYESISIFKWNDFLNTVKPEDFNKL